MDLLKYIKRHKGNPFASFSRPVELKDWERPSKLQDLLGAVGEKKMDGEVDYEARDKERMRQLSILSKLKQGG